MLLLVYLCFGSLTNKIKAFFHLKHQKVYRPPCEHNTYTDLSLNLTTIKNIYSLLFIPRDVQWLSIPQAQLSLSILCLLAPHLSLAAHKTFVLVLLAFLFEIAEYIL